MEADIQVQTKLSQESEKPGSVQTTMLSKPKPQSLRYMPSTQQERRISKRSIKRKKFDDELVESSLIKTERNRIKSGQQPVLEKEKIAEIVEKDMPVAPPPEKKKEIITNVEPDPLRELFLQMMQFHPSLVFNVLEPGSRQCGGYHPSPDTGLPNWCVCGKCREMPTDLEKMCYGTTDITGDEQETIYIRTVMKGVVKERFLNISTPNSTKCLDLFENVMQVFKENNINESRRLALLMVHLLLKAPLKAPVEGSNKYPFVIAAAASDNCRTLKQICLGCISASKTSKSSKSRSKRSKAPVPASTKDLGRWKPQDDLALITAVQQTNDLTAVHLGVKFSCKFTLKEIQERWYALLYDPMISKLAVQAMKMLHPEIQAAVQAKALYSKEEETLLGKIISTSQPNVEIFQDLLEKHPDVFYPTRTAKALHNHWLLMKQYHLLPDQSVQPMPRGDHVLNFSDAEDMLYDEELKEPKDEAIEQELSIGDRKNKREIRHLEQELPKWQVLVDSVTGISPPDFDNQTLAVLRGRLVRYLMRSREITLGRATKDNQIDVDLSLEGPAWKISRRQGIIKLRNNGDFFIANEGKRAIYIDGKPILHGMKQKMNNNSVVEISCLRFIFLINQDLINAIRNETHKVPPTTT